jgi:putative addiction module component (TIGR02574 family)
MTAHKFNGVWHLGVMMSDLGIDQLTSEQRIALALEIWQSLGDDRPSGPTDAQQAELAKRDAGLDANPEMALTWEKIRANVEKRKGSG